MALALLVAIRPGATRILIPILLVAYLAPFVASPDAVARFIRRGRGGGPGTGGHVRAGSPADEERDAARRPGGRRVTHGVSVPGPVALHGGGEFEPGDEPFLDALLTTAGALVDDGEPIRVAVVPTAAAGGRPDLAAAHGVAAFERVAGRAGRPVRVEPVMVVDATSAADPTLADRLRAAHVIHFPGGDPGMIPRTLPGTAALAAIEAARGAAPSSPAPARGRWRWRPCTWTSDGDVPGLAIVPGRGRRPARGPGGWARTVAQYARPACRPASGCSGSRSAPA